MIRPPPVGRASRREGRPGRWERSRGHAAALVILLLLAGGFAYSRLDRGWNPSDEGTLAHAAERVLQGELPHRDFDDVYTGGLALLNAAAFRVLGVELTTPRLLLFGLYLIALPAIYYLASRFIAPGAALVACALALVWNIPGYPAAMPSWYNLLLALLGTAALVRHGETGAERWIFAAGILAGISCALKITGVYFVAGALLYFLFAAQDETRGGARVAGTGSPVLHLIGLAGFAALTVALIGPRVTAAEFLYFLMPVMVVVAVLVRRELRALAEGRSVATPYRQAAILVAGLTLPLLALALPYAASGSLDALLTGVFVAPLGRITIAARQPPAPPTLAAGLPLAAVLYLIVRHGRVPRVLLSALGLLLAAAFFTWNEPASFAAIIASMRWVPPLAVGFAGVILWNAPRRDPAMRVLFLLTALTALISLVQYPLAHPVYFWFVAPLAVLVVAGIAGTRSTAPPLAPALLAVFYVAFTVQQILQLPISAKLTIPRAGLWVTAGDKATYERAVALLRQHARGAYTYAGPDAPELYFLSGLRNPTRHLFEFLAQEGNPEAAIIREIERHDVNAIALHHGAHFSRFSPELIADLEQRFPRAERMGDLEVRWRP